MKFIRSAALAVALFAAASTAHAQNEFKTPTAGKNVVGVVVMCLNGSSQAVPCSVTNPLQVTGGGGGGGGGTSSNFTAAFPTAGTAAGFTDGTNMVPARVISGDLQVKVNNLNANGQALMANSAPVAIASDQAALPNNKASATGGAAQYHLVAANSNNATNVKNSAGTVYSAQLAGLGSAPAYLKFYDKATSPTCNSDPVKKTLIIPAASTAANGAGSNISFGPTGINFASGISICVVTGIADNDNTSVAASTFTINFDYQ